MSHFRLEETQQKNSVSAEPSEWSFVLTKPRENEIHAVPSIEKLLVTMPFSPAESAGLLRFSFWDKTPKSYAKANYLSPFDTTCQKRSDYSPFSPGLWKSINTDLKRRKGFSFTPSKMILESVNEDNTELKSENASEAPNGDLLFTESKPRIILEPKLEFLEFPQTDFGGFDELFLCQGQLSNTSKNPPEKWSFDNKNENHLLLVTKDTNTQEEGCNCRSTGCLKLYCQCLRAGKMCVDCNCSGCENHQLSSIRKDKITLIEKKHPQIFASKNEKVKLSKKKGCNCRRSNCQKNYCECHQFGLKCGDACKCIQCKNLDENSVRRMSKDRSKYMDSAKK